jgi:membrane-bound ClpP family serine protease
MRLPIAGRLSYASAFFAALLSLVAATSSAFAQGGGTRPGLFVTVPAPLTSDAVSRIKTRIEDARSRAEQRPAVVILDFNPNAKDATTDDFGVAYTLARYLSTLHDLTTVASVTHKVSGHLVFPVLACRELAMGANASIGDVLPNGAKLTGTELNGYTEVLGQIRPTQLAIARKMAEADVVLRKGRKAGADFFLDLRDRAKLEKEGVTLSDTAPLSVAPDGKTLLLPARSARDLGVAQALADDRRTLAEIYALSTASLKDDPLDGRVPVAYRYQLRGPVDPGSRESVRRVAEKVVREGGNILLLVLDDCGGGDLQAARDLADDLRRLQNEQGLTSVAFVPNRAPDTAAVVALGATEIILSLRTDAAPDAGNETPTPAELGDFEQYLARNEATTLRNLNAWISSLRDLAETQGYSPLLVEGMLKRDLEIVRARMKNDRSRRKLMTTEELEADRANWESDGVVKPKGQLLKFSATRAEELGLARATVPTRDISAIYSRYGLDASKVRDATPAWLDLFANFLKRPPVTVLLVVIAFMGLILEMKVPGTTVPGIVAALCFVLVFWAHTQFSGQIAALAGMLLVLGLVLILIEVFITPGFGAAGIFGILLMLGALALVTVDRVPETSDDWSNFGLKMGQYLMGMMIGIAGAFFFARFLPHVPYVNRMMLMAPDASVEPEPPLPGAAEAAALLGAVGTAVTVLRPAGSVRFGENYVDVVTDGGYVPAGSRVQVVEVEGNRIVVKEV